MVETYTPEPVRFSRAAADKVRELAKAGKGEGPNLRLRVFVTGGGCSGFAYGFAFDAAIAEDDTRVETDGVTLVVDSLSIQYLAGSRIDYREDLQGAQFVVENPNATSTCGCGNSFSI